MRKALGSTLLALALTGGLVGPTSALPTTDDVTEWPSIAAAGSAGTLTQSVLTPAAAAALRPRLTLGSRGPAVVHVQQQLGVTPTSGYYGPLTRKAVKKLQKANGLPRTGRVTRSTWKVLLATPTTDPALPAPDPATETASSVLTPAAAAALRPRLALGSRGPAVVHVQQQLGVTPTSGYYGPLTRKAVKKLQKANGLPRTGRVTRSTWKVLLATPTTDPALPAPGAAGPEPTAQPSPPAPDPLTPEQAAAARPTLRQGMGPGDPAVVFVQRYLRVTPDSGYFGTLTRAAVIAYQEALSISPTGTVGPLTWEAIAAGRTAPVATGTVPSPTASPSTDPAPPTFTPPEGATPREVAVAYALAQVGKPYVLGGNGPEVFDCSGLVQQAYLAAGVKLPRLASQQRFAGTRVDLADLLPGDLLYYQDGSSPRKGHISMYAGDGRAVEAANPRRGVRVRDLAETWYRDRFVAAVRIG